MSKDPVLTDKRTGAVYQLSCRDCGDIYIGQTGRTLG